MSSSSALIKRQGSDMALMPPPPIKRIKRPATVLDEDDYTEALTNIIERDYFPGLVEVKAQDEYLSALESRNDSWITEAAANLRNKAKPTSHVQSRSAARDFKFDTPRSWHNRTPAADTPRGNTGSMTPMSTKGKHGASAVIPGNSLDASNLSLSEFQAKYTSEDNESFNTVLDKQNAKRREKHAHLWTSDQRIPTKGLIAYRASQDKLIEQKQAESEVASSEGRELISITSGAVSSRPAQPDTWRQRRPDNAFMFNPSSIDEDGLQTIMEVKEANSKAGQKQTVYSNTRFPPLSTLQARDTSTSDSAPPSPSLNTSIIARRDANRASRAAAGDDSTDAGFTYTGGETPRVNGYSFVDEDEPENIPFEQSSSDLPTYRDLLAGQHGSASTTPNPFTIHEHSRREDLHHRLVEKEKAKRRAKERETMKETPLSGFGSSTPVTVKILAGGGTNGGRGVGGGGSTNSISSGNMTPAARKLMEKLNRTPVANQIQRQRSQTDSTNRVSSNSSRNMWTPGNTPRRR